MAYISQYEADMREDEKRQNLYRDISNSVVTGIKGMEENRLRALAREEKAQERAKAAELHKYQLDDAKYKADQRALGFDERDSTKELEMKMEAEDQRAMRREKLIQDRILRSQQARTPRRDPIEVHREKKEIDKQYEADKSANSKKPLSAGDILKVNEGAMIPSMLQDVEATIAQNPDLFSPVTGTLNSWNPFNEKAKTAESQLKASSQAFGKFMEGGVLKLEDEKKYEKMMPQFGDSPEVARNKLQVVQRLLTNKLQGDVTALHKSGYDVSGINANFQAPSVPQVLNPQAQQASSPRAELEALRKLKAQQTGGR